MVKFVNRGLNGYTLISDGTVHLFDGMSRKCVNDDAGMFPEYVLGAFDVDVLSVIRRENGCEVFYDLGSSSEKHNVFSSLSSFIKGVYKRGGYLIALTRDFVVGNDKYTQYLFVYNKGSLCTDLVK